MRNRLSKIKWFTLLSAILPALWLIYQTWRGAFAPFPTLFITQYAGRFAVYLLLLSLASTPIRNIFSLTAFIYPRKIWGLASFYYAILHAFTFIGIDYQFNLQWLVPEFRDKPYLLLGLAALIFLLLMAVTSIKNIQKGIRSVWIRLHKGIYFFGLLILIHQYLAIKGDKRDALILIIIYSILMLLRIPTLQKVVTIRKKNKLSKFDQWLKA